MKKLSAVIKTILGTAVLSTSLLSGSALAATIEVGSVEVGNGPQTVNISGFTNPVIIAGVPSLIDDAPGAVSVSNVTATSFDISFKEWPYLDGVHSLEKIPYMVVEKGRHVMADGSVWEAGTQSQDLGKDETYFSAPFAGTPVVLQTNQTQNDNLTHATRAFSVSRHAFGSQMFDQEAGGPHAVEITGYLAIYNANNAGQTDNDHYYNLSTESIDGAGYQTTYGTLTVQEETSADAETSHVKEVIGVVEIADQIFAHDNSLFGGDPMTLRYSSAYEPIATKKTGDNGNIALIGTNNLIEGSYTSSYLYSASFPVAGAFDGHIYSGTKINDDAGTAKGTGTWIAVMNQGPQWIQVDFGQTAHITGFSTETVASLSTRSAKDVILQVSDDGLVFTDHQSITLSQQTANVTLNSPAVARYMRLKVLNSYEATYLQIGELEYYGSFVEVDPSQLPPPMTVSGKSCNDILQNNPGALSGVYHIDPDEAGSIPSFDAFCDMATLGGGWTLVGIRDKASYPAPETHSITDLSVNEGVLPGDKWMALRDMSTEIYAKGSTDVWATFNIDTLKASTCVPLSNNLTDSVLVQVEADCSSSGVDYSEIGSPDNAYSTAIYDLSNTPIFTGQGGTQWGSGGNWANPPILYLYVK